jgi:hypothetical protein
MSLTRGRVIVVAARKGNDGVECDNGGEEGGVVYTEGLIMDLGRGRVE